MTAEPRTAAELIALRARWRLERRLAWLDADDGADVPEAEQAWNAAHPSAEAAEIDQRLEGPEGIAWRRLKTLFGLTEAEAELLQLAVAVVAEPALAPLVARAQSAPGRLLPSEPLVKRLAMLAPPPIWHPTSPLAIWSLARPLAGAPGEPAGFAADPRVADWLHGVLSLDQALVMAVNRASDDAPPADWPIAETADRLRRLIGAGREARLIVEARPGAGRWRFAAAVASALGRFSLVVDPAMLPAEAWSDAFMRLQRFALFADFALIWREGAAAWPARIPLAPVQAVCIAEDEAAPARAGAVDVLLRLPEPGVEAKAALWRRLVPQLSSADRLITTIPGLSVGDIHAAGLASPATVEEAGDRLRSLARTRLHGEGRVVDPHFGWDDLVVPPDIEAQLRRIAFEARSRAAVLGEAGVARLFAGVSGLTALLSGPPGVGKSMSAQVLARDLGVNLLIVDLAATTSKFVGETAKNLSRLFARARAAGAALLFEEADSYFARRTEVKESNDRHANSDTGHLLQLLESHDGLVILCTNRRANIDPAFIRRLRHVVEFPRPGPADRARIWRHAVSTIGAELAPLESGLGQLAARFDISPAQIKSAVLTGRYAAMADDRPLRLADFEAGAVHELTKEGRSPATRAEPGSRRLRSIAYA